MSRRVTWRTIAVRDLAEVHMYLEASSPEAAERLLDAVEAAIGLLLENPGAGTPREPLSNRTHGIRSWVVRSFPSYLIFYGVTNGDLEVLRFLHGARDLPQYFVEDG